MCKVSKNLKPCTETAPAQPFHTTPRYIRSCTSSVRVNLKIIVSLHIILHSRSPDHGHIRFRLVFTVEGTTSNTCTSCKGRGWRYWPWPSSGITQRPNTDLDLHQVEYVLAVVGLAVDLVRPADAQNRRLRARVQLALHLSTVKTCYQNYNKISQG